MNDNSVRDFAKEIDEAEERVMKRNFEIIDEIEKLKSEELRYKELKSGKPKTKELKIFLSFSRVFSIMITKFKAIIKRE